MLWPARPAVHQSGLVAQELLREAAGWACSRSMGQAASSAGVLPEVAASDYIASRTPEIWFNFPVGADF